MTIWETLLDYSFDYQVKEVHLTVLSILSFLFALYEPHAKPNAQISYAVTAQSIVNTGIG